MTDEELRAMLDAATPGPWEATRKVHKSGTVSVRFSGENWADFARVWVRSSGCESANQEGEANARLIAAAPDLAAEVLRLRAELAALKEPPHARLIPHRDQTSLGD